MLSRLAAARNPAQGDHVAAPSPGDADELNDRLDFWGIPSTEAARFDEPELHPGLQELLCRSQPLAWLIAGNSLTPAATTEAGLCDRITAAIRSCDGHPRDRVMDAAWAGGTIAEVRSSLPELLAHRPDILLLMGGPSEWSDGVSRLPQLESDVTEIIRHCAEEGVLPILTTCPVPLDTDESPGNVEQLVLAETFRALAAEWDAPLIDLRAAWEQAAIPPESPGSWYNARGTLPSSMGLSRIAQQLAMLIHTAQADPLRLHETTADAVAAR